MNEAAAKGHADVVELLLARGADVNPRESAGASALENASRFRHVAVMELLMAHGATLAQKESGGREYSGRSCAEGPDGYGGAAGAKGADVNARNAEGSAPLGTRH